MISINSSNILFRFQKDLIGLSKNTKKSYERDLLQFVCFLDSQGVAAWSNIDARLAKKYLSFRRREGDSATTIARKLSTLRKFFFWLKKEGLVAINHFITIKAPRKEKKFPNL